jgi:hypothetical protein
LTININRSKAKRTHYINAYVKTNLPQLKKVYLIIWLSGFWALENPKVGVRDCPICNLSWRIKESQILFCQNRVENLILIILGLFPMKNTQF